MRFAVSLSRAAKKVVTVRAATADRTARAGADYRKKSAKLRFAPGQTKKSFLVRVLRDTRAERTETLKVKLSSRHQRDDRPGPGHRHDRQPLSRARRRAVSRSARGLAPPGAARVSRQPR